MHSATMRAEDLIEVLDALPSLVAFVDREGRTLYVNRAARVWLGREPSEAAGLTVRELVGEDTYTVVRNRMLAALGGEHQSFECVVALADGEVALAMAQFVPRLRDGRPDGFAVLVTDMTSRAVAEAADVRSRHRLEELATRSRSVAGRADDVLQDLFAIQLYLQRLGRFPDEVGAVTERVIDPLAATIEQLRGAIKQLVPDPAPTSLVPDDD